MHASDLAALYEISYRTIRLNLRDIGHDESMLAPPGGANCINWVLGHVVAARGQALRLAGAEPVWDAATAVHYGGDEATVWDPARALPLAGIVADFEHAQERLAAALAALPPAHLERPAAGDRSVGQMLAFLQFHEAYHAGQLGILRRIVGKPGVIKPRYATTSTAQR